jgi:glycosyltransferase involved in cell wall biosynthesis
VNVTLHSFETSPPVLARARFEEAAVKWVPHPFGREGQAGGGARIARAAAAIRRSGLVHARSHPAALAAMVSGTRRWVWDVRALWIDQRVEQGMLRAGSLPVRALRAAERQAARRADSIVTLAAAAIPALEAQTGHALAAKTHVVSTCVDLDRFVVTPPPPLDRVRLLLSGSLNALYDVPAMLRLAERIGDASVERVGPGDSPWETALLAAGVEREELSFSQMPARVAQSHAGLCVLRPHLASSPAAAPTKVAEFLACGRPVVVNAGLGDLAVLVTDGKCGVVVDDTSDRGLDEAAAELRSLLEDPGLAARCRAVADEHFDLERAVDTLVAIYRSVATSRGPGGRPRG